MPDDVGRRRAGRTLCLGCSDGGWRRQVWPYSLITKNEATAAATMIA